MPTCHVHSNCDANGHGTSYVMIRPYFKVKMVQIGCTNDVQQHQNRNLLFQKYFEWRMNLCESDVWSVILQCWGREARRWSWSLDWPVQPSLLHNRIVMMNNMLGEFFFLISEEYSHCAVCWYLYIFVISGISEYFGSHMWQSINIGCKCCGPEFKRCC